MSRETDAFVIVHHPKDGSEAYGIGPFPPIESLADTLIANARCVCRVEVLWVGFPTGIKMAFAVPQEMLDSVESLDSEGLVN